MVTVTQKAVLGSMLISERCIPEVLAAVTAEDFTDPDCRILFLAVRRLYNDSKPVDPVTVLGVAQGKTEGGLYDLVRDCMTETPTAANIGEYLPLLKEEAQRAKAQGLAMRLIDAKTSDQIRDIVGQLNALMVDKPGIKVSTMKDMLEGFFERQKTKVDYLTWGDLGLEKNLKIRGGKFVLIGGYPSDGKTALALSMATAQAQSKRVGFFSLETDDATIADRQVARMAGLSMGKIKDQALDQEDYDTLAAISPKFVANQVEVVDANGMTAEDIISFARYRRYEVIYIDYVQLIRPSSGRTRTEEISAISIALHNGARATGITVVGLSQLSRPERVKGKIRAPRLQDLRESGQLEQDADGVMLIYRANQDDPESQRVLSVEKNKEGPLGMMYLRFDGLTQTFSRDYNRVPPKPKREEPEDKQLTMTELQGPDPDLPFKEGVI